MSDYDKQQWQAEQAARDAALEEQREKYAKARERSARNAKRKLERLKTKLTDEGEITDFESEFSDSVLERIDEFGAAFADPQLGRPGDALSAAQKQVVARMNRKAKDLRKKAKLERQAAKLGVSVEEMEAQQAEEERDKPRRYSSFKSKGRAKGWTPRVRQLDEDFGAEECPPESAPAPEAEAPPRPPVGKPFLRIVK